jgi:hypothetical protein
VEDNYAAESDNSFVDGKISILGPILTIALTIVV